MKRIEHPRRLLVVGSPTCDIAGFVTALTGSAPVKDSNGSVAGSIHEWSFSTKYYTINLPLWIDEIADIPAWKDDFSKPEAKEVIEAVGGWIYCFDKSTPIEELKTLLEAIDSIINQACGYDWDGVKVLAAYSPGMTTSSTTYENETVDDLAADHGFELIDANAAGKNAFGEQQGFARIIESVEANDWTSTVAVAPDDNALEQQFDMEDGSWDMKAALLDSDGDADGGEDQLRDFESLIASAQAIKELGQDLNPDERKKLQERAARDLLSQTLQSTTLG